MAGFSVVKYALLGSKQKLRCYQKEIPYVFTKVSEFFEFRFFEQRSSNIQKQEALKAQGNEYLMHLHKVSFQKCFRPCKIVSGFNQSVLEYVLMFRAMYSTGNIDCITRINVLSRIPLLLHSSTAIWTYKNIQQPFLHPVFEKFDFEKNSNYQI